jgi:hypothetical protein
LCALGLGLAVSPYFRDRLGTFRFGTEATGARPYLVEAGWEMFRDHPVWGVGVGGYQDSFVNDYYYFKDPKIKANVTLSHTSARPPRRARRPRRRRLLLPYRWGRSAGGPPTAPGEARPLCSTPRMLTSLSARREGRFFDDPTLAVFGLGVACPAADAQGQ